MFSLENRRALVTGAGRGVGAGIAQQLADSGAEVWVNDISASRAEDSAQTIRDRGGLVRALPFDVCDYQAVRSAMIHCGRLDILVNNAGVPEAMTVKPFAETLPEDWRDFVDLNLYGVMNCCHAALPAMREAGYGRIVTVSSGAGVIGIKLGVSAYAAGKGGGISFMRHLAMEEAAHGITANSVAVGLINNHQDPEVTAQMARAVPVRRLGEPSDVAALSAYLCAEESSWMTGQTLQLNGGASTT